MSIITFKKFPREEKLKLCVWISVITAARWSHLLSHEIQPALQGIGDFNLAVAVVDLHASGTETFRSERSNKRKGNQFFVTVWLPEECSHVWGEEVVLVDANLQVGLHGCFVDRDVLLDGSLKNIIRGVFCVNSGCTEI